MQIILLVPVVVMDSLQQFQAQIRHMLVAVVVVVATVLEQVDGVVMVEEEKVEVVLHRLLLKKLDFLVN
jgi:hypothetical protein